MIAIRRASGLSQLRGSGLAIIVIAVACLWLAASAGAARRHDGTRKLSREDLAASFQAFCAQWMEKVHSRDLRSLVTWEKDGETVQGTYIEYSEDYTCTLTDQTPPVGKINYRETLYAKRGKTIDEAARSSPEPITIFETREFFSYSNGRWAY